MLENLRRDRVGNNTEVALLQRGFEAHDLRLKVSLFLGGEFTRRRTLPEADSQTQRQEKSLHDTRLSSVL